MPTWFGLLTVEINVFVTGFCCKFSFRKLGPEEITLVTASLRELRPEEIILVLIFLNICSRLHASPCATQKTLGKCYTNS